MPTHSTVDRLQKGTNWRHLYLKCETQEEKDANRFVVLNDDGAFVTFRRASDYESQKWDKETFLDNFGPL